MIAILPQTVHDLNLTQLSFKLMAKLFITANAEQRSCFVDNGLTASVTKTLTKFFQKWGTSNDGTLQAIQSCVFAIAYHSITVSSTINVS